MSKCDIRIDFDRRDRSYRAGEQVGGEIHIRVNQDVNCRRILVKHYWQTHGSGNKDRGHVQEAVLFEGQMRAGELLSYPFQFTVPHGPPTYHGHHLNIDHYIDVRVDVPWAFDPKFRDEYFHIGGSNSYDQLSVVQKAHESGLNLSSIGLPTAVVMIAAGTMCFFPFGLILIPVGCAVLFFSLRKTLAERKLGPVSLQFPQRSATPGGSLPLALSFTPTKQATIRGITATLIGNESCVSGSGTNKKTHKHKLYEQKIPLAGESDLMSGKMVSLKSEIQIPDTNAYSFKSNNNNIVWTMTIQIDIPTWPDWLETIPIQVSPASHTVKNERSQAPATSDIPPIIAEVLSRTPPERTETPTKTEVPPVVVESKEVAPVPEPMDEPSIPATTANSQSQLVEKMNTIMAANRYGSERNDIVTSMLDEAYEFEVEVDRVDRTYGMYGDDLYHNGKKVRGKLTGNDLMVEVTMYAARNEELESTRSQDLLNIVATATKWNSTFDRLEMRETV